MTAAKETSSGDFEITESTPAPTKQKTKVAPPEVESKDKKDEKKEKYTEDELLKVFDEIIFSGEYSEDVKIRGKLSVTLKTRTSGQISVITDKLDKEQFNLRATVEERRSILNLQDALIKYQGRDLSTIKVEEREKFLGNLPAPIVGALLTALSNFDEKVYKACEVGEENF